MRRLIANIILLLVMNSCGRSPKEGFRAFFGFSPTSDVKNIRAHSGDALGFDASYWLAFECSDSTADKIIEKLELSEADYPRRGLYGELNNDPTTWWDTTFIFHAKPFIKKMDDDYWFLWHDKKANKVYFLWCDT